MVANKNFLILAAFVSVAMFGMQKVDVKSDPLQYKLLEFWQDNKKIATIPQAVATIILPDFKHMLSNSSEQENHKIILDSSEFKPNTIKLFADLATIQPKMAARKALQYEDKNIFLTKDIIPLNVDKFINKDSQSFDELVKARLNTESVDTIVEVSNFLETHKIEVFAPYIDQKLRSVFGLDPKIFKDKDLAQKLISAFALNPDIYNAKNFPYPDGSSFLANKVCSLPVYDNILLQNSRTIIEGGKYTINSAVVSSNGNYIAIVTHDNKSIIYNTSTGTKQEINTSDIVNSVAFSPDNKYLVTASQDKTEKKDTAKIYTVGKNGNFELNDTIRIGDPVKLVAFSPDSKFFAITYEKLGENNSPSTYGVLIYGVNQKTNKFEYKSILNFQNKVFSVVFSQNGQYLVASSFGDIASSPSELKIFDILKKTEFIESSPFRLADVSPDGKFVVAADDYGNVIMYDMSTKKTTTIIQHKGVINSVKFSPNGKYIVTASSDNTAQLYDIANGSVSTIDHRYWVRSAVFSPNGRYVVTASLDGTAAIYDVEQRKTRKFIGHSNPVKLAVFSSDSNYVFTALPSGEITVQPLNLCGMPDLRVLALATLIEQAGYKKAGKTIKPLSQDGWVYKAVMQLQPEERGRLFEQYKEVKELVEPSRVRQFINFIKSYLGN